MSLEVCELLNGDYAVIDRSTRYICPVMLRSEPAAELLAAFLERFSKFEPEAPGEVLVVLVERFISRMKFADESREEMLELFMVSPEAQSLGMVPVGGR